MKMDKETRQMKCSCKKFEWKGLPCAHMFRVYGNGKFAENSTNLHNEKVDQEH